MKVGEQSDILSQINECRFSERTPRPRSAVTVGKGSGYARLPIVGNC